jgi:hypothetical protein
MNNERPLTGSDAFRRIRGIELLSPTAKLVGSLHPDNIEFVTPGSQIELILLSRCSTPTIGSALLPHENTDTNIVDYMGMDDPSKHFQEKGTAAAEEFDLFWVLYVIWQNGIAERRGLGQVLHKAVTESWSPGPVIKEVLLG